MAFNSMGLGVTFTARDAMSGTLFRLQRAFSGLEQKSRVATLAVSAGFAGMATGIGLTVAGLAGLGAAFSSAASSGQFTADLVRLGRVAQATSTELAAMRNQALDLAEVQPFKPDEIVRGMEDIAAMGFDVPETSAIIEPALELATAGRLKVADAAGAMAAAMKVFSKEADESREVADKLLRISNATALQPKDLLRALGTVGRGATIAKQDLDEMLISMGLVRNAGVVASKSARAVSTALEQMATKADKFQALGVEVGDAEGKFRNLGDIVLDVDEAMKGMGLDNVERVALAKDLFGSFGITTFGNMVTQLVDQGIKVNGVLLKGRDAMDAFRASMNDTNTTVADSANAVGETYTTSLARLNSTLAVTRTVIGEVFEETLLPLVQGVAAAFRSLNTIIRETPGPVKQMAAVLFLGASVMTVFGGSALFVASGLATLTGIAILAGTAILPFLGAFAVLAAGIVVPALAAGAALTVFGGALAFGFSNNIGGIADDFREMVADLKTQFMAILTFFKEGKLTGPLAEAFSGLTDGQQDFVVDSVLILDRIKTGYKEFVDELSTLANATLKPALLGLMESFAGVMDSLGFTSNAFEDLKKMDINDWASIAKNAAQLLAAAFKTTADTISGVLDSIRLTIRFFRFLVDNAGTIAELIPGSAPGIRAMRAGLGALDDARGEYSPTPPTAGFSGPNPLMAPPPLPTWAPPPLPDPMSAPEPAPAATGESSDAVSPADAALQQSTPRQTQTLNITMPVILDGKQIHKVVKEVSVDENNYSFGPDEMSFSQ